MKRILIVISILFTIQNLAAQIINEELTQYEPSDEFPFGRINPEAPEQLADFEKIIGLCDCKSVQRNPDGTWQDTLSMLWKFKYIMNGFAVQDEVWRTNNLYAGSIRQFQSDSSVWVISYFSYPSVPISPNTWLGNKVGSNLVFKMPQKAPNGMDGTSRLTFYNIEKDGFEWIGEWVSKDQSTIYPFWSIHCTKRK